MVTHRRTINVFLASATVGAFIGCHTNGDRREDTADVGSAVIQSKAPPPAESEAGVEAMRRDSQQLGPVGDGGYPTISLGCRFMGAPACPTGGWCKVDPMKPPCHESYLCGGPQPDGASFRFVVNKFYGVSYAFDGKTGGLVASWGKADAGGWVCSGPAGFKAPDLDRCQRLSTCFGETPY